MEIGAHIDYYESGVATFDPQKVVERLFMVFPGVRIEHRDLAQDEIDNLLRFLDANQIPEPRRGTMLQQIRNKAARNGPIYTFQLDVPGQEILTGRISRYRVSFQSEGTLDIAFEYAVIQFLLSLHLGVLTSDTPTSYFQSPHPDYPGYWMVSVQGSQTRAGGG